MSFLLFIVASVLKSAIAIIGYLIGFFSSLIKGEFKKYHLHLAISIDQYGNCLCQYLFNSLLITKEGYKFGNIDETISSVLGKNKMSKNLTGLGRCLDYLLNLFEKDHSIKSIDNSVNDN